MMLKEPRPSNIFKRFAKVGVGSVLIGELAFCAYSYYHWRKMNNSREYRYVMYQRYPKVLKGFYWTSEKMGYKGIREADYYEWGVHFNKKVEKGY